MHEKQECVSHMASAHPGVLRGAGLLVLENLPAHAVTEAAIAAAQLLQHAAPAAAAVLLRPGALAALLGAAADEICAAEPGSDLRAHTLRAPVQVIFE